MNTEISVNEHEKATEINSKAGRIAAGLGLSLALMLGPSCAGSKEPEHLNIEQTTPSNIFEQEAKDIELNKYQVWLDTTKELLTESALPEADKLLSFIDDRVILKGNSLDIVPPNMIAIQLVHDYNEVPKNIKETIEDQFSIVLYSYSSNTIYLDENLRISNLYKGLATMHELFHAEKDLAEGDLGEGAYANPQARAQEEVRVYDLMFKVLDKVMDDQYNEYIDGVGTYMLNTKQEPNSHSIKKLEQFFGTNLSSADTQFFELLINRHGYYRIVDKHNAPQEASELKIKNQLDRWDDAAKINN